MIRGVAVLALCVALAACSSPSSGDQPADGELSPQFLDMLAPVSGDSGARADESARLLLARAEAAAATDCMADAGFEQYAELPVLNAQKISRVHPEFVSPAKLEDRGLVVILSDPALDDVPVQAQQALDACLGATSGAANSVSRATDRFTVYRDGAESPLAAWPETLRAEVTKIAESDDAASEGYRECFRQLGVPADVARNPTDAIRSLVMEMNEQIADVPDSQVDSWRRGDGVVDGDGGAVARAAAGCLRQFEAVLTPRLQALRDDVVEEHREELQTGQRLFEEAIGSQEFDPSSYDF